MTLDNPVWISFGRGEIDDLVRRVFEHWKGDIHSFRRKHAVKILVYYEAHETMPLAIQREKNLKRWNRQWKLELIEGFNPKWDDLWSTVVR